MQVTLIPYTHVSLTSPAAFNYTSHDEEEDSDAHDDDDDNGNDDDDHDEDEDDESVKATFQRCAMHPYNV